MDWKELKHEINMSMVDFIRTQGLKCNILVLGKKEHEVLQSDETKKEFFRNEAFLDYVDEYKLGQKFGDSSGDIKLGNSGGDIEQIWGMRICRINVDSVIKAGHVV